MQKLAMGRRPNQRTGWRLKVAQLKQRLGLSGRAGGVSIAFGMGLPLVGCLMFGMFVSTSFAEQMKMQKIVAQVSSSEGRQSRTSV
mmetsp:Transcript_34619/g.46668  ORF Transcript_34619/g.46668 Transcript_34619/m.46668 type:complete len:86 (-) Transcript_34619:39-296(-)